MIKPQTTQSGFALLLSIIVASIVLSIGLTLLSYTVKQLTLASVARESEIAFMSATAGLECIQYWSGELDYVTNYNDNTLATIDCMGGVTPKNFSSSQLVSGNAGSDDYINEFTYEFEWSSDGGSNNRCTYIEYYVMQADNNGFSNYSFAGISEAVGDKDCPQGSSCSVAIAQGYNRDCDDLDTSLVAVQRELTAEF